ncbi:MAG: DUF1559 domain-containing protein [Verrucomicrobiota bacterium]
MIELLTVIAIIAILAGILIPVVGRVRESARNSQCTSNLRQIGMGMSLFAADNQGLLPPAAGIPPGEAVEVQWSKWLDDYLPQQSTSATAREHPIFLCPSTDYEGLDHSGISRSYSATASIYGPSASGVLGRDSRGRRRLNSIENRPVVPMVIEGKRYLTGNGSISGLNWTAARADTTAASEKDTTYFDFRHGNHMNVLFADGSVRGQSLVDTAKYNQQLWEGR